MYSEIWGGLQSQTDPLIVTNILAYRVLGTQQPVPMGGNLASLVDSSNPMDNEAGPSFFDWLVQSKNGIRMRASDFDVKEIMSHVIPTEVDAETGQPFEEVELAYQSAVGYPE